MILCELQHPTAVSLHVCMLFLPFSWYVRSQAAGAPWGWHPAELHRPFGMVLFVGTSEFSPCQLSLGSWRAPDKERSLPMPLGFFISLLFPLPLLNCWFEVTQTLFIEDSIKVFVPKYHLVHNAFYLPQLPMQRAVADPFSGSCLHRPHLFSVLRPVCITSLHR